MVNIQIELDDNEKDNISQQIEEYVQTKLLQNINRVIGNGIEIDKRMVRKAIDESILKSLDKQMTPLAKRIMDKYVDQLDLFTTHLIAQNEKLLSMYSKGADLTNVKIQYLEYKVYEKQDAEKLAIKYYAKEDLLAFKFHSRMYYNLGKKVNNILDLIRNSAGLAGAPDLVVISKYRENNNSLFFLAEVKTNGDGIRENQMRWYQNHPEILINILYINQIIIDTDTPAKQLKRNERTP